VTVAALRSANDHRPILTSSDCEDTPAASDGGRAVCREGKDEGKVDDVSADREIIDALVRGDRRRGQSNSKNALGRDNSLSGDELARDNDGGKITRKITRGCG
jgi:hypothetical protein